MAATPGMRGGRERGEGGERGREGKEGGRGKREGGREGSGVRRRDFKKPQTKRENKHSL